MYTSDVGCATPGRLGRVGSIAQVPVIALFLLVTETNLLGGRDEAGLDVDDESEAVEEGTR